MRKKMILILFALLLFFTIDNVYATCYKIRDTHTGLSRYSTSVDNVQSFEIVETVKSTYCNSVKCGKLGNFNKRIPEITSWVVTVVQVLTPVLLVVFGSIDFIKSIVGQKEDDIKRGKQLFIKRIITAVLIFFIVAIIKVLIGFISSGQNESENIIKCIDCFISNKCD